MAYPYQITTGANLPFPWIHPPIYYGGAVYGVLYDGVNDHIEVWKGTTTTDPGDTWAEVDVANHKQNNANASYQSIHVRLDSSRVRITFIPTGAVPRAVEIGVFDMSTDLWETSITGGPTPLVLAVPTNALNTRAQAQTCRRSTGDLVTVYSQSISAGNNFEGLDFAVYSGGVWGGGIDLIVPGTTEDDFYDYELLGLLLDSSDRVHVWTRTAEQGYAHVTINPDNSVTGFIRFYEFLSSGAVLNARIGSHGIPSLVTFNNATFLVFPFLQYTQNTALDGVLKPAVLFLPEAAIPSSASCHIINEELGVYENWESCCCAYDSSTGAIYLVWTRRDIPNDRHDVRISCFRGGAWSTPSDLFQTSASSQVIETVEMVVSGGQLRAFFENSSGDAPYHRAHYFQAAVSCAGGVAPTGNHAHLTFLP